MPERAYVTREQEIKWFNIDRDIIYLCSACQRFQYCGAGYCHASNRRNSVEFRFFSREYPCNCKLLLAILARSNHDRRSLNRKDLINDRDHALKNDRLCYFPPSLFRSNEDLLDLSFKKRAYRFAEIATHQICRCFFVIGLKLSSLILRIDPGTAFLS